MISDYLKRCRELSEVKPAKGEPGTVHTSPAYVKLLNHAITLERDRIPDELFDGHAIYENLPDRNKLFIKTSYVSDVLDSAVALIRERLGK